MNAPTHPTVEKVGAFILRRNRAGQRELLLFHHADMPEVPVQIPGGTLEVGCESIEDALHREILEESGLARLEIVRKVGVSQWFWKGEQFWVKRHVYLLIAPPETPETWIHTVSGTGTDAQLRFAYHWLQASLEFKLPGDLGIFLTASICPSFIFEAASGNRSIAGATASRRLRSRIGLHVPPWQLHK